MSGSLYTPYVAADVAAMIEAESSRWDHGACETGWVGTWDSARGIVTSARLVVRGNNAEVPAFLRDYRPGDIDIHVHPAHQPPYPSEADLRTAVTLDRIFVGMLIVTADCRRGYLVRAPTPPRLNARTWQKNFGRWQILLAHYKEPTS